MQITSLHPTHTYFFCVKKANQTLARISFFTNFAMQLGPYSVTFEQG